MGRRIRRGVEIFGKTKKLFQDRGGAIRQESGTLPADSFPRYDLETPKSGESKERLLRESLSIAWRVLQEEQVLPLANGSLCVAYGNRLIVDTLGGLQYREEFIMTSTDGGSIWTSQLVTSLPEFHVPAGGKMVTELNGYISGGDPLTAASVLHTTNGGATWVRESTTGTAGLC